MFEEPKAELFDREEMKAYASGKLDAANQVKGCIESPAWKLFRGLVRKCEIETLQRDDYATLEDFRSDRAGLKMLKETVSEFEAYAEDAESAMEMLNKLQRAESQTPLYLESDRIEAREEG